MRSSCTSCPSFAALPRPRPEVSRSLPSRYRRRRCPPTRPARSPPRRSGRGRGKRVARQPMAKVLVVENAAPLRQFLRLHLETAGHQVQIAEDVGSAERMAAVQRPDLILAGSGKAGAEGCAAAGTVAANAVDRSPDCDLRCARMPKPCARRDRPGPRSSCCCQSRARRCCCRSRLTRSAEAGSLLAVRAGWPHGDGPARAYATASPTTVRCSAHSLDGRRGERVAGWTRLPPLDPSLTAITGLTSAPGVQPPRPASPETRIGTVLFADIRNFSALAETLTTQEVADLLNSYFVRACEPILQQGGWIVKLLGDGVLAMFEPRPARTEPRRARAEGGAVHLHRGAALRRMARPALPRQGAARLRRRRRRAHRRRDGLPHQHRRRCGHHHHRRHRERRLAARGADQEARRERGDDAGHAGAGRSALHPRQARLAAGARARLAGGDHRDHRAAAAPQRGRAGACRPTASSTRRWRTTPPIILRDRDRVLAEPHRIRQTGQFSPLRPADVADQDSRVPAAAAARAGRHVARVPGRVRDDRVACACSRCSTSPTAASTCCGASCRSTS